MGWQPVILLTPVKAAETGVRQDTRVLTFAEPSEPKPIDVIAGKQKPPDRTARFSDPRLAREWQTVAAMVRCYCQGHHDRAGGLCTECQGLLQYAAWRLERCRFGADKPTCARCPVHCYHRQRREQMRVIMRFAGPQMLWRHPLLALRHWLDGFRTVSPEAYRE